jgi:hypothetical protein
MSRNHFAAANRTNRNSQNELTLPPIVEAQIINDNVSNKKNGSRVDSGITPDYSNNDNVIGSFRGGNNWTLSTNGSEDDIEYTKLSPREKRRHKNIDITTVEVIDRKSGLKKNPTSSTFISYGKRFSFRL